MPHLSPMNWFTITFIVMTMFFFTSNLMWWAKNMECKKGLKKMIKEKSYMMPW